MTSDNLDLVKIEKLFLERRFRPALQKCNVMLQSQSKLAKSPGEAIVLATPIKLTCMGSEAKSMQFKLDVKHPNTSLDQVGAIALQSWYEIWRYQQNQHSDKGTKFLEPFLECFANGNHGMGFPLCILLVTFLMSVGNQWDAIAFGGELMHVVLSNKEEMRIQDRQMLARVMLTKLLPTLTSVSATKEFLWGLQQKEWVPTSSPLSISLGPQNDTIDFLRNFLKTPDSDKWGLTQAFKESCLGSLESAQSVLHHRRSPEQAIGIDLPSEKRITGLGSSRQGFEKSLVTHFLRACNRLQKLVKHALKSGSRQEKGMITFLVASLFTAVRKRAILLKISKKAIDLITLPIREVIQALIPQPNPNSLAKESIA